MRVTKRGNRLVARREEGEAVEIETGGSFGIASAQEKKDLIARLRKYRGRAPIDFVFDR